MAVPKITLNNGKQIPAIGLGTVGKMTLENLTTAINLGFRHLDTAWAYHNEEKVGEAIRNAISAGTVKREDIFVTTKLWENHYKREQVVPYCKESLKNLGLDYIDLYLIHWPVSFVKTAEGQAYEVYKFDLVETWKGLEECVELGLVKSIGFSNFNEEEISKVLSAAKIKPVMNQIEVNPLCNQKNLIAFCKKHQIAVTAYSPLTAPYRTKADETVKLDDPKLTKIGQKYEKTVSQVVLRYLLDIGVIPIPKSSNEDRLKQNLNIFDFKLTPEEIEIINGFNRFDGVRYPHDKRIVNKP